MQQPITLKTFKAILSISAVAAITATVSALVLNVPVWATFIGWIAFFTRGMTARAAVVNLACVLIGLGMGIASGAASQLLTPYIGPMTITVVVLIATFILLSVALLPEINNVLGYFLGLVCYFASNLPPTFSSWVELSSAVALGVLGGLLAMLAQTRCMRVDVQQGVVDNAGIS